MSRTFRNSNSDGSLNAYALYRKNSINKNKFITDSDSILFSLIRDGNCQRCYSVPKKFRQYLNRSLRAKHKHDLIKAFNYNLLDNLFSGRLIHNAHYLYW